MQVLFGAQMMMVDACIRHGGNVLAGAWRRFGAHMNVLVGV